MAAFTALAIGSLALGVYGQVKAGKKEKEAGKLERAAAESEAELAEYNAQVADLQAADALARGAEEENRFRMEVRGIIGTQRASLAASNVDVNFGSAVDVQADAAYLGELDAMTIRNNAAREAWGFQVQAEDLRRRAEIVRKGGAAAEAAGGARATQSYLGAASTLLGGAATLVQQRYGAGGSRVTPKTTTPNASRFHPAY